MVPKESKQQPPSTLESLLIDRFKQELIIDTCHGVSRTANVLNLHNQNSIKNKKNNNTNINNRNSNLNSSIKSQRDIPMQPSRILDAVDFKNDFYSNLLDWSETNKIAVALNQSTSLFLYCADTNLITEVFTINSETTPSSITCCLWLAHSLNSALAVGNSLADVEIWDAEKCAKIRSMQSHVERVQCLAWSEYLLASGSKSGKIHLHDVRVREHNVGVLQAHTKAVCGLTWRGDGRFLASGGNDDLVMIWDARVMRGERPLHVFRQHLGAVKALAWCPWKSWMLASGGGTMCQRINLWNVSRGELVHSANARSQVSCVLWSKSYRELISSHGFREASSVMSPLVIWRYESARTAAETASTGDAARLTPVCELQKHEDRVLSMAMSPSGHTVASVGPDEKLCFWECFKARPRKKEHMIGEKMYNSNLGGFIR